MRQRCSIRFRSWRLVAVAVAATGLAVTACATPSNPATVSPPVPSAASTTLSLDPTPTGTVTLSWSATTHLITAKVDVSGFTPNSSHAMHIHPGSCADQTRPPSVPFGDIHADAGGSVAQTVVSSRPAPVGIPSESYVNIHLAPTAQLGSAHDFSYTPIACANIPAGAPANGPVALQLRGAPTASDMHGSATYAYDAAAHTLRVSVRASGLAPNSAHAAHIHAGTCHTQGDVVHPLPDLHADSSGQGTLTTVLSNVSSPPPAAGWYVNVHLGPMSAILSHNKPTLFFAPILCGNVRNSP